MSNNNPIIYLLADQERYILGLSSYPELEIKFHLEKNKFPIKNSRLFFLTKQLSWGIAHYIFDQITDSAERQGKEIRENSFSTKILSIFWDVDPIGEIVDKKIMMINKILGKLKFKSKVSELKVNIKEILDIKFPEVVEFEQVYKFIKGRKIYYNEIRQVLRENRVNVNDLNKVLVYLKLLGKLRVFPSVTYNNGDLTCQRCGNVDNLVKIECNYCNCEDYYCQECILMGEARLCRPLYLIPADNSLMELNIIEPKYRFNLTELQQEVSDKLIDFLYEDYQQALVWAVCGAGKTEVSFEIIADVLSQGGKVLFAIPRKDVVIELSERLKEAFPGVDIKALYGGSLDKYQWADLIVATTHQVLRYYQAFDLIVLDEVDAFPYRGSKILKRAIRYAKKPKGKIVYMTATPSEDDLRNLEENETKLIKLSARYHGHPLPEPELIEAKIEYDKESKELQLPQMAIDKIKLSIEQDLSQVFVFVPSRELVDIVTGKLIEYFPEVDGQDWIQGSHSQDLRREEKRESFLAGDYPVLVSTTIMERGVTVEKANVIVLFADLEYIFSEETLIQMAGRSGRSLKYPTGKVWFIGDRITEEMQKARDKIRELNQESAEKGYLKYS
ncbi:DEAD/DEAH box helicase [Orenia marismortui]|uniref:Competence protein ComFA n=1 Tax=Orenia marismortui TaxID=46469 RepID=A0A4R8HFM5_9FIRM|nr:DEAD/DEAH box helicase family protein [Orenia marismortui]TDX58890.1 competence protein ComFA [Orenia marismortui]